MNQSQKNKQAFERNKPNLNVCTMGHVDHGKTTLTSAITFVQSLENKAKFMSYDDIDKTPEERKSKITISVCITEYETENYHVIHSDTPGHEDFVKNATIGFNQADNGILLVSATDGAKPQTKEHLHLTKRLGIELLIVAVTKLDMIEESERDFTFELIQEEITDIAVRYGFKKENLVFIRVFSLWALEKIEKGIESIKNLIKAIDKHFQPSPLDLDKPFLMSIESTYDITGRGKVVAGKVRCGKVSVGDKLQLVGFMNKPIDIKVGSIEMFNKFLNDARASDNPGILLNSTFRWTHEIPTRGQCLIQSKAYKVYKKFQAQIYIVPAEDGGRKSGFKKGYKPQFFSLTADVTGEIYELFDLEDNIIDFAKTGSTIRMNVELLKNIVLEERQSIAIREGKRTVGSGRIIKLLE